MDTVFQIERTMVGNKEGTLGIKGSENLMVSRCLQR